MSVKAVSKARPSRRLPSTRTLAPHLVAPPLSKAGALLMPLLERPAKSRQPPKLPAPTAHNLLRAQLAHAIQQRWAPSTADNYRRLWRRYSQWAGREHLPVGSDDSAALFITATQVRPSGQLAYAKILSAIFGLMAWPTELLRALISGLAGMGARRPTRQAAPMSMAQLEDLLESLPLPASAALRLAWVTASRWDDVTKLRLRNVVEDTADRLILHMADTKASRSSAFRPEDLVVIVGRHLPRVRALLQAVRVARNNNPRARLTRISTRQIEDMLRPHGLSAHSIKRGALAVITAAAAAGTVPKAVIGIMAKHAGAAEFVSATPTYLMAPGTMRDLALLLGTAKATAVL